MKVRLLLVLLLLFVTMLAHAQEAEPALLEVAGVTLRLRSGPSTDDEVIARLTPRAAVELLQRGEQWSQVRSQDGQTGWAHNDFLLPWDERNRPDALRRVGEKRLFRVRDHASRYGGMVTVNAELRAVSDHSYIYTYARARNTGGAMARLPSDGTLLGLGEKFDTKVYRQSLSLWNIEEPPAFGEDERVVILIVDGFGDNLATIAWYVNRRDMPQEAWPHGTGFIGIGLSGNGADVNLPDAVATLAHEFQHMLHDQTGGNQVAWVSEGLAEFSAAYLGVFDEKWRNIGASFFLRRPRTRLNDAQAPDYGAGLLFTTYLYERLGLDALRDFATRPQQGLAALDALLAERGDSMNADSFFADWVLANFLLDTQRDGGRYGYQMMGDGLSPPPPRSHIRKLPTGFRESLPPYSTDYFELPGNAGTDDLLLLDFRLSAPPPQDAWVQLVQVLPDSIDVQRFRASDYLDRPVLASVLDQAERRFVAVSPFATGARQHTQPLRYSLALRVLPALSLEQALVTATLNVRSEPEIADNILGKLLRCSRVQVLESGEEWSKVLGSDGLSGWSHNDFLLHPELPGSSNSRGSCAALTRAARVGNLAAVQQLLAAGHPVNGADAWGRTALHEAAFWGHDAILQRLLRAGADIHARDAAGRSAHDEALASGNASNLLLDAALPRLDLDAPASQPLMILAATQGNTSLLDELLDRGHDVNWQDEKGQTALAAAASQGQETTLARLLAAGADTQRPDENGRTPLMQAAANGQVGTLAMLYRAGVDVNRQDRAGHTALTLAAARGQAHAVAWLLLGSDVSVHHTLSASSRNALHLAALAGHDHVVAQLLLRDLDVGDRDGDGRTALQLAEAAGHSRVVELLHVAHVAKEPLANSRSPAPQITAVNPEDFLAAARNGDLSEVERLINSGVGLELVDKNGRLALKLASMAGRPAVVLRLLHAGVDPDFAWGIAIQQALRAGHDEIGLMLLVADGQNLSSAARLALSWAAEFGRNDIARLMIALCQEQRRCVDLRKPESDYKTPLHYAALHGHEEIVGMLLEANADPDARDEFRTVPLFLAIIKGYEGIVERLLDAGADPNAHGDGSLLAASRQSGNPGITSLLLAAGAKA